MNIVDKCLQAMNSDERETFICYLSGTVKNPPGISGSGAYLGSIAPLVFATDEEKAEALKQMARGA